MTVRRADDKTYTLLDNATATGSAVTISGGQYALFIEGTWSSASAALEVKSPKGTWVAHTAITSAVTATANLSRAPIDLPSGEVRIAITGSPSAMYAYLVGLG